MNPYDRKAKLIYCKTPKELKKALKKPTPKKKVKAIALVSDSKGLLIAGHSKLLLETWPHHLLAMTDVRTIPCTITYQSNPKK